GCRMVTCGSKTWKISSTVGYLFFSRYILFKISFTASLPWIKRMPPPSVHPFELKSISVSARAPALPNSTSSFISTMEKQLGGVTFNSWNDTVLYPPFGISMVNPVYLAGSSSTPRYMVAVATEGLHVQYQCARPKCIFRLCK